jgi:hypothetical protein
MLTYGIGDGENEAVLCINLAQLLRGRSARALKEAGVLPLLTYADVC